MRALVLASALAFGIVPSALAQSVEPLLPAFSVGQFDVKPFGWTWSTATDDDADALAMARVRFPVTSETSRWGAFVELDVTNGIHDDQNWLRLAYVTYEAGSSTEWRAGRLFLSPPRQLQPPFLLRTARYERHPFDVYGYGVQVNHRRGGTDLTVDVTANTGTRFNEAAAFEGIAMSSRVTHQLSEQVQVGGVVQLSEDVQRYSVETTWRPDDRHTVNAVAYQLAGDRDTAGGFVFYGYKLRPWVELHAELDYQSGAAEELLVPVGVRLNYDRFQVVVDHELVEGGTFVRLQTRF